MTRTKKKWSDLTPRQQQALIAGGKWRWALAMVVQPFGPIAYLTRGRRASV